MKKRFVFLCFIAVFGVNSFSQTHTYTVAKESSYIDFYDNEKGILKKSKLIEINNFYNSGVSADPFYYAVFDEEESFIPLNKLKNEKIKVKLPDDFISSYSPKTMFLYPEYVVDAVKHGDRNIISQNDKVNCDELTGWDGEMKEEWYFFSLKPQLVSNIGIILGSAYGLNVQFFVNYIIKINDNEYKVKVDSYVREDSRVKNPIFSDIKNNQEVTLRIKKDGDYLEVFTENETTPREKYCYVNDDFRLQINQLVENNYCDNSILVWPHHADGTSEYEDTIRYPEPVIIEEPEEIKIEEYQEENKEKESEKPPIPDENDPNFLEILRVYYPEYYSSWAQVFKYRRRMQILKISIISAVSLTVIIIAIIIIIKKKRRSAK